MPGQNCMVVGYTIQADGGLWWSNKIYIKGEGEGAKKMPVTYRGYWGIIAETDKLKKKKKRFKSVLMILACWLFFTEYNKEERNPDIGPQNKIRRWLSFNPINNMNKTHLKISICYFNCSVLVNMINMTLYQWLCSLFSGHVPLMLYSYYLNVTESKKSNKHNRKVPPV